MDRSVLFELILTFVTSIPTAYVNRRKRDVEKGTNQKGPQEEEEVEVVLVVEEEQTKSQPSMEPRKRRIDWKHVNNATNSAARLIPEQLNEGETESERPICRENWKEKEGTKWIGQEMGVK
uniref:Uncharacterized protein n=1 Tax=Cacopsylla melanoneura TaxID=428564 RepID=A0A8D8W882_9HEMI